MARSLIKQSYTTRQESGLQSTVDYEIFVLEHSNRRLDLNHVEFLCNSIRTKNMLKEYPIVVTDKWVVIDGQHRLEAAKFLGVPIYYIVSSVADVSDIAAANSATKKWTKQDYLEYHCAHDRTEYIKLKLFLEQYDFLTVNKGMDLLYSGDKVRTRRAAEMFENGEWVCNSLKHGTMVAKALLEFSGYVKFYASAPFVFAVKNLMSNRDYHHKIMMRKMIYLSTKLVNCPDLESFITVFNSIYNHGASKHKRVDLCRIYPGDPRYIERRDTPRHA